MIGTRVGPVVWGPQVVQRFTHTEKARSAMKRADSAVNHTLLRSNISGQRLKGACAVRSQFAEGAHLPLVFTNGRCGVFLNSFSTKDLKKKNI